MRSIKRHDSSLGVPGQLRRFQTDGGPKTDRRGGRAFTVPKRLTVAATARLPPGGVHGGRLGGHLIQREPYDAARAFTVIAVGRLPERAG